MDGDEWRPEEEKPEKPQLTTTKVIHQYDKISWGRALGNALIAGGFGVIATSFGYLFGQNEVPDSPEPCIEESYQRKITTNGGSWHCSPGAKVSYKKLDEDYMILLCKCPNGEEVAKEPPDASAPDAVMETL